MKKNYLLSVVILSLLSCKDEKKNDIKLNISGTWQLISATTTENGISHTTDFSKDLKMIKIINDTHFAFLKHSLNPKDSAIFDAGGGSFDLNEDEYTEHLEYYKDKNWEGKSFKFKVKITLDTLTQIGVEKVEKANIDRIIEEKYIKIK